MTDTSLVHPRRLPRTWVNLKNRAVGLRERMDDPDCDPDRLRRTFERFYLVNGLVSGWNGTYRSKIRPAISGATGAVRILDIGCGSGDVLRRIVRLARRDGFDVTGLGIDPDPFAIAVADGAKRVPGVTFRRARSDELLAAGESFDVVLSNHLLHHLGETELASVIADSRELAARVCVHSDIERSWFAYAGFALIGVPFARGSFIRVDGLRSIRRSYRRDELAAVLPPGWSAVRRRPSRLLAVYSKAGP